MGVELELLVLLMLSITGQSVFARFEIETHSSNAAPHLLLPPWLAMGGMTFNVRLVTSESTAL